VARGAARAAGGNALGRGTADARARAGGEAAEIFRIVRELNEREGTAVLLVEQNARTSLAIASRAYVLEVGAVAYHGTSEELAQRDSIRKSYLGY
jgi:ABC-type branched-subunit amino acid transport system ATPase component